MNDSKRVLSELRATLEFTVEVLEHKVDNVEIYLEEHWKNRFK